MSDASESGLPALIGRLRGLMTTPSPIVSEAYGHILVSDRDRVVAILEEVVVLAKDRDMYREALYKEKVIGVYRSGTAEQFRGRLLDMVNLLCARAGLEPNPLGQPQPPQGEEARDAD